MSRISAIIELVERFDRNRESYLSAQYNETQLRREFLDPFFEALGWDVNNRQGYAEAYKDVIHEDSIKIGGLTKAPDYCFRIGGVRKFFVEAKKPAVNLKQDENPAFQVRRYAWSAKLPLSILTDFEEFAVYDCRVKPVKTDKASTARILYFTYKEYEDRWEEIAAIFSRDAILKGSFDKYAEKGRHKKGTAEVDDAFLKEIEEWRDSLAKNIALRNPDLTQRELNFSVQRTIDRIIFLRICEDRGIEEYGRLQTQLNGTSVYKRLVQLFSHADDRYNSGLFHFQREKDRHEEPDKLTPNISIDDKPLKEIINRLYYPESPYEFSVLSADILGQVYEQFLGKVIRLTAGHQAKVEEKPEVRKAGGVYYTPKYIVDYIVKNTVGKLVEDKKPKEVEKLRVLDPACGSGSFLLGAYQYLLDWHRDWYTNDDPAKWSLGKNPVLYQAQGGDWRLTTSERKRILLNNIYGVDIDSQAVEVTKLSLLLKVLEGENSQTIGNQLRIFHQRALPDLGDNIKCGNSLIGPDFFQQQTMLDDEERLRINVFDWEHEFSGIMKAGGFDAVIGNPPYYKVSGNEDPSLFKYYKSKYTCAGFKTELYVLFAEKAISLLIPQGMHSFIVPNSFLAGIYLRPLRFVLAEKNYLNELLMFNNVKVFADAKLDSVVYTLTKQQPDDNDVILLRLVDSSMSASDQNVQKLKLHEWKQSEGRELRVIAGSLSRNTFDRIRTNTIPLKSIASVHLGLVLESNDLLKPEKSNIKPNPILLGRDIERYGPSTPNNWFWYGHDPIVGGTKNQQVYMTGPRIVLQAIRNLKLVRRLVGSITTAGIYAIGTVHNIIVRDERYAPLYLLGIINSNFMNSYYTAHFPEHRIKGAYIDQLPVPCINDSNPADKAHHAKMVSLVDEMLSLNKQLSAAKTDQERTALQRQIDATDRQIDHLVYELYGLTEEEIKIVEGGTKSDSSH